MKNKRSNNYIAQLIAKGESVVIIDLKGDRPLLETVRLAAGRNPDAKFKRFSNEKGVETNIFNPFLQSSMKNAPNRKITEYLINSLEKNWTFDFFHGRNLKKLCTTNSSTLRHYHTYFESVDEPITSFKELDFHLRLNSKRLSKKTYRDMCSVVRLLANIPTLNFALKRHPEVFENAIHMGEPIQKQCVYYFSLNTLPERTQRSKIARLALWCFLHVSMAEDVSDLLRRTFPTVKRRKKRVYLFVDELQQVAPYDLETMLDIARGFGFRFLPLSEMDRGLFKERDMQKEWSEFFDDTSPSTGYVNYNEFHSACIDNIRLLVQYGLPVQDIITAFSFDIPVRWIRSLLDDPEEFPEEICKQAKELERKANINNRTFKRFNRQTANQVFSHSVRKLLFPFKGIFRQNDKTFFPK